MCALPRLEPVVWNSLKSVGIAKRRTRRCCRGGTRKQRPITSIQGYGNRIIYPEKGFSNRSTTVMKTSYSTGNMQISSKLAKQDQYNNSLSSFKHHIVLHEPKRNRKNVVVTNGVSGSKLHKPYRLVDFCLLNTRSIRNKTSIIKDFLLESKFDILALTETWLQGDSDNYFIRDITPTGYIFKRMDRQTRGGGVGLLYSNSFSSRVKRARESYKSFEYLDVTLSDTTSLRVIIIYRPPPSVMNGLTVDMFFTEFTSFLEQMNIESERFLIAGDFNFPVKNQDNNGPKFMNLLETFNLIQHVQEIT